MMSKITILVVALMLFVGSGCSLIRPGTGTTTTTQPAEVNWVAVSKNLETVTVVAATLAFNNTNAKQYEDRICEISTNVSLVLKTSQDKDLSLAAIKQIVDAEVMKTSNPEVRKVVSLVMNSVLQGVFDYVWQNYSTLIQKDEARIATLLGQAIVNGLNRVCESNSV